MASPAVLAARQITTAVDLSGHDPEQTKLMDERCILVDEEDKAIGAADKKTCSFPPSPNTSLFSIPTNGACLPRVERKAT